jgi:hypothetical protein
MAVVRRLAVLGVFLCLLSPSVLMYQQYQSINRRRPRVPTKAVFVPPPLPPGHPPGPTEILAALNREKASARQKGMCTNQWAPCRVTCRGDLGDIWSIGFISSNTPEEFLERGSAAGSSNMVGPAQTAGDVHDLAAVAVADPFLFHLSGTNLWYVFMEVVDNTCQKGAIGVSVSDNLGTLRYQQVVLTEFWHLSFPRVLPCGDKVCMTTCATGVEFTESDRTLWLYSTTKDKFPLGWQRDAKLLHPEQVHGAVLDPVLLHHDNTYFLFFQDSALRIECVFFSDDLRGPYTEHPRSKRFKVRHSGSIVPAKNGQFWVMNHVSAGVRAIKMTKLSRTQYEYAEGIESAAQVLKGGRTTGETKWRDDNMHTLDLHLVGNDGPTAFQGKWVGVVDGMWVDTAHRVHKCLESELPKKKVSSECQQQSLSTTFPAVQSGTHANEKRVGTHARSTWDWLKESFLSWTGGRRL